MRVRLGRNSYDIFIGALDGAADEIDRIAAVRDVAVITDANVAACNLWNGVRYVPHQNSESSHFSGKRSNFEAGPEIVHLRRPIF